MNLLYVVYFTKKAFTLKTKQTYVNWTENILFSFNSFILEENLKVIFFWFVGVCLCFVLCFIISMHSFSLTLDLVCCLQDFYFVSLHFVLNL